jgi:hypothetical protein
MALKETSALLKGLTVFFFANGFINTWTLDFTLTVP